MYGADLIGVSPDRPDSHQQFRTRFSLPFNLLADHDKKIARLYDVARRLGMGISRVTYLIDKHGIVREVFHHEFQIAKHVDNVLKGLKALDEEPGTELRSEKGFARAPGL